MSYFTLDALTSSLGSTTGMTHAIYQSIFNHAKSTQNDRERTGDTVMGGHWGNEYLTIVGSRDWTLNREKLTSQTLTRAKKFYQDALAWLIEAGYATAMDVNVSKVGSNAMARVVTITLMDGQQFEVSL